MRIDPRSRWLLPALCGALAVSTAGCGGGDPSAGKGLSGTIRVDGSSALYPFVKRAADEFQQANPGVRITVGQSGTVNGFNEFCAGETAIADALRQMTPQEVASCAKRGRGYAALQVASDGVAVIAGPTSRVRCLSMRQLARLWGHGSKVDRLAQLGTDPGTGKRLPKTDLTLYAPPADNGPFDLFTLLVNGEEGAGRADYQTVDDAAMAPAVAADRGGIGYLGFAAYRRSPEPVNLVNVDGGTGCISPSTGTIQDASYALSGPMFMYPSRKAVAEQPPLRVFLRFVEGNSKRIAAAAGLVPMSPAAARRSDAKLKALPSTARPSSAGG